MQTCEFLLELISVNSAQEGLLNAVVAAKMRTEVQGWLAKAKQRQQEGGYFEMAPTPSSGFEPEELGY